MNNKIDIVIPWVDGSDSKWLAQKSEYTAGKYADDNANRYRDWDNLKFWFRGVEKFAPWVNKVHFITWGHIPSWLNTECEKLNIVKHSDYIPEKYLPVFSSHPIELNMLRIPDLSDKFIYFNDDTFLTSDLSETDFFKNGLPVDNVTEVPFRFKEGGIDHIIGNNMMVINKNFNKKQVIKANKKQWFSLSAIKSTLKNIYMLPVNSFSAFDNPHLPIPYLKSTLEEVWSVEEEQLDDTCSHRFRNNEDVNQWLFRYWQFMKGTFCQSKGPLGMFFSIGCDDQAISDAIKNGSYKMVCLSDDDKSLDFDAEKEFLTGVFSNLLSEKSSFEK